MHDQPAHHRRRDRPHRRAHLAAGLALLALLLLPAPEAAPAAERVLATGDSMMYVMQQPLARRLRHLGHEVVVDGRFGTGITKPEILDWRAHARFQAAEFTPTVTFVFLGASDAWPIDGVTCCGARWRALYGERVRDMTASYGRTIWMTLPAPRDRGLARVFRGVNRAIVEAVGDRTEILDLRPVFTPGGRYRRRMTWNGRRVVVRQMDGVHLGHAGVKIASDLAVAALT